MFAARYTLEALDPLWFRGLGPAGNAWDPSVLHATAINFALATGLGFKLPHTSFPKALWTVHSLPYPSIGLWASPARLLPGTAVPVEVFRGGRSGGTLQVILPANKSILDEEAKKRGCSGDGWRESFDEQGNLTITGGKSGNIGKPFLSTGYFGQWTGVLLARDSDSLDLLSPDGQAPLKIGIRLGPNRVLLEMRIQPMLEIEPFDNTSEVMAEHLLDPCLLPDDLSVFPYFAKPYPLVEAPANGIAGDLLVRTIPFTPEGHA